MVTTRPRQRLSLAEARRVALAAQGFGRPRAGAAGPADLVRLVRRLGVLQIDSVNVLARAHLMPPYSRLGAWDATLLERASATRRRRLVEAWAHQASYVPVESYRLFDFRREAHARDEWVASIAREHPDVVAEVAALVRATGPVTARRLQVEFEAEHPKRRDHWGWNWSVAKRAVEYLFFTGQVAVAGRNAQFERSYDIPERVLPAEVLAAPSPARADAVRELVRIGARGHGVGTVRCIADYFRLPVRDTQAALEELTEAGEVTPVAVEGWRQPAFLHASARVPRRVEASALLSPFDPLIFERRRLEALFSMRYRIGIYTPAAKRTDGYYVLPFLSGERLAARLDLKADRAAGVLWLTGAWRGEDADGALDELASELERLAGWLALQRIAISEGAPGDLTGALAVRLGRTWSA